MRHEAPVPGAPAIDLAPPSSFPVGLALAFYGVAIGLALGWRWLFDGEWPWGAPGRASFSTPARIAAGLGFAGLALGLSRAWARFFASGARLAAEMERLVGPIGVGTAWLLALASGFGEELLFRGAVQPHLGWIVASLLFGAVHFLPGRGLWVWTVYAAVAGFGLGALFWWTGDVLAPAVAHTVLNGVQLQRMGRENRRRVATRSPASAP